MPSGTIQPSLTATFFRNYNAYSIACAIPVATNIFFGASTLRHFSQRAKHTSTYQLVAFIEYYYVYEIAVIRSKKWYVFGLASGKIGMRGDILETKCQCAAASGVRDGSRSPATGFQEQVANRRKRLWLIAIVVSVTEKVL